MLKKVSIFFAFMINICASNMHIDTNISVATDINASIDKDAMLNRARELSVSKRVPQAIEITKELLSRYPDSDELTRFHAKLLFWDGNVDAALEYIDKSSDHNSTLYHQIHTSSSINHLKSIKNPMSRVQYIDSLAPMIQTSYDVLWIKHQSYIEQKRFANALEVAKMLVKSYPQSQEAAQAVARLLFWNSRFKESLAYYQKISKLFDKRYIQEIRQLRNIISAQSHKYAKKIAKRVEQNPDQIKFMQINQLLSTGRKIEAIALFDKQSQSTKSYIQKNYKSQYCTLTTQHMVGIGYGKASFFDDRYEDYSRYIEMTIPMTSYTIYTKLENTHRYNMSDTKLSAEIYPQLPKPYWGYLQLSITPDADFYSQYSIGWHQYYDFDRWELGLAYDFSSYKNKNTHMITTEYSYLLANHISFSQTLYYLPDGHNWALDTELKYKDSCHRELSIAYTQSKENEKVAAGVSTIESKHLKLSSEYPISTDIYLGASIDYKYSIDNQKSYTKKGLHLFLKHYW